MPSTEETNILSMGSIDNQHSDLIQNNNPLCHKYRFILLIEYLKLININGIEDFSRNMCADRSYIPPNNSF